MQSGGDSRHIGVSSLCDSICDFNPSLTVIGHSQAAEWNYIILQLVTTLCYFLVCQELENSGIISLCRILRASQIPGFGVRRNILSGILGTFWGISKIFWSMPMNGESKWSMKPIPLIYRCLQICLWAVTFNRLARTAMLVVRISRSSIALFLAYRTIT